MEIERKEMMEKCIFCNNEYRDTPTQVIFDEEGSGTTIQVHFVCLINAKNFVEESIQLRKSIKGFLDIK